jgi:hypothetical protein
VTFSFSKERVVMKLKVIEMECDQGAEKSGEDVSKCWTNPIPRWWRL